MVRMDTLRRLEGAIRDVGEIRPVRFFVYRAAVELGVFSRRRIDSVHVYDGHWGEEDLVRGFGKTAIATIPAGAIQEKTVDINAFLWSNGDVVLVLF